MNYNLANPTELKAARNRINYLAKKKRIAIVKERIPNRTLSQNSYLHLIIGAFAANFGYTMEEAKQIYKECSPNIYIYEKKGRRFLRSSAKLSKEEMAITIDKFMEKSKEAGFPLPLATDEGWLREIENEIDRHKYYL